MNVIPANTPQWVAARRGILTASRMADAMCVRKDGTPSASRESLLYELWAERETETVTDRFVTAAMQWGIDNEAAAVSAWTRLQGELPDVAGLVLHPTIPQFAATPDRFVGDDGLLEVKCPTTPTHLRYLREGKLPADYAPQVHAQLACTGRAWCEFISFDPRVSERRQLLVVRVMRDEAEIQRVEAAAKSFLEQLADWQRAGE